jgi:hypothetical protein
VAAAIAEIGGAWLAWQGVRESKADGSQPFEPLGGNPQSIIMHTGRLHGEDRVRECGELR